MPQWKDQTTGDLGSGTLSIGSGFLNAGGSSMYLDPGTSLQVDLSSATAATINQLREALRMQRWLETSARAGSR